MKYGKQFGKNKKNKMINCPFEHQQDLKTIIDEYLEVSSKIIEIGCGTGLTSLILDDNFDKTLLDKDERALSLAKNSFDLKDKHATFINSDIFIWTLKIKI